MFRKKTSVPCSFLENGFVNTAFILGLMLLDIISIFDLTNSMMESENPTTMRCIAITFAVFIDFAAVVLGPVLANKLRRQTLHRVTIFMLVFTIILGASFLVTMRYLSRDITLSDIGISDENSDSGEGYITGSDDVVEEIDDSDNFVGEGIILPNDTDDKYEILKRIISIFMGIQVLGTSVTSFCLSAIRSIHMKFVYIERLERQIVHERAKLQNLNNMITARFPNVYEEALQNHTQICDRIASENQRMKETLYSRVVIETGMSLARPDTIAVTPSPEVPYASASDYGISQNTAISQNTPVNQFAPPPVDIPEFAMPENIMADTNNDISDDINAQIAENAFPEDESYDLDYEKDV